MEPRVAEGRIKQTIGRPRNSMPKGMSLPWSLSTVRVGKDGASWIVWRASRWGESRLWQHLGGGENLAPATSCRVVAGQSAKVSAASFRGGGVLSAGGVDDSGAAQGVAIRTVCRHLVHGTVRRQPDRSPRCAFRTTQASAPTASTAQPAMTDDSGRERARATQPISPAVGMILPARSVHALALAIA
jgi:hypothetical protein